VERGKPRSDNNAASPTPYPFLPHIPGVDTATGISMTGGTVQGYCQVLSMFRKDSQERLPMLQTVPLKAKLQGFTTQVHALKSASATLGATELSAEAARLEAAGKADDLEYIKKNLGGFAKDLAELVENIRIALEQKEGDIQPSGQSIPHSEHLVLFHDLAAALETKNATEIDRLLEELNQKPLDSKNKEVLETISDHILMTEFGSAIEIIDELINTSKDKEKT
jgi:HPt (histidine-containing phosphotransfer) domain-containing protein